MARSDWWLRIRINLADEPEVIGASVALAIDPDLLVGKLVKFWGWAKKVSETGRIPFVTGPYVDGKVGLPGFAQALVKVGWLLIEEEAVVIPDFAVYLSKEADGKALTAARQARLRTKGSEPEPQLFADTPTPVTENCDSSVTREEKRREEKTPTAGAVGGPQQPAGPTFTTKEGKSWQPSPKLLRSLQELFPHLDVEAQLRRAHHWHEVECPHKKKTARGMAQFLTNWMKNEPAQAPARAAQGETLQQKMERLKREQQQRFGG